MAITLIWGATFILVKQALADVSTLLFLTIRFAFAALVLALIFRKAMRQALRPKSNLESSLRGGVLAGLSCSAVMCCRPLGLHYTTASKAGFLTGFMTSAGGRARQYRVSQNAAIIELAGVAIAFLRAWP